MKIFYQYVNQRYMLTYINQLHKNFIEILIKKFKQNNTFVQP